MGRKNDDVSVTEESPNSTQLNSEKKKKKNKNKDKLQNETTTPKRKQNDIELQQNDTESTKKKNKKNKHHVSTDTVDEETKVDNGNGDETVTERVVVVTGKNAEDSKYAAVKTFAESGLPEKVLECCKGFKNPSPIQSRAWPFLLDGRDLIGIAATGSGKTLAFGIPAIMHIMKKGKNRSAKGRKPLCLMLSPTRELAQQISDVMCDAGRACGVESICLYGGTSKGPQISSLKSGVDIIIGTPGRIQDLIEMGVLSLKEASFVVLDEADRMLDMGFEQVVRSILGQTSSVRQMVMFSATWPLEVHHLAQEFMDPNPVKVVVGSEDLAANHDVMQIVEVLDERARDNRLVALLEKYHKSQRGWKAVSIHGDKAQHARTKALSLFKEGTCPLMVATDVAARGLDIPDVEVVINYSFPLTTEDYVHRIGRTGRAGKKGVAHTFFTQQNKGLAGELVNVLREAGQNVPEALMKFGTHVKKKESKLYGAHFKEIAADAPKSTKIKFDSDDED
ncbi:hypothetical protein TanjilG_20628 [Lupinus angustifolius]|uniref:RNA helicase n=1 Tax=Lupinus angustifolius TaxID=3871 RepID=A0A4P1QRK5_LUPAN|nr:hypothetical protein TanjilG_20628 [Lupinus angustifolius]